MATTQMSAEIAKLYESKKVSALQAISRIPPAARIVLGHAGAEPCSLAKELAEQLSRFEGAQIAHMLALGECHYCQPGHEKHIRHRSLFVGPGSRRAVAEGRADYVPVFFSEIPRLFREGVLPVDVALIQVSPPDEQGYCSFGLSVDYSEAAAEVAKLVIAEVNFNCPRTHGSSIHLSQLSYVVESNDPSIELKPQPPSAVDIEIGKHVASLIPDRANLQVGIGALPDAVLAQLGGKRDLGVHTEMMGDGLVDLYHEGVVTNAYNNLNPGKFVATFLLGTSKLYRFVDDNPLINMQPVDYTNGIRIAGQVERLMSINSALEVDLMGQVVADTLGHKQYSGVGGQVDFVRAASASPGGKAIIALPSTAKGNSISKIVATITPGSAVTTSRNDVHFVVTEYGIADLRGKSLRERADALIAVAHPDFREQLRRDAAVA
jgi:4-hydroxybutyrate CoA-transferase